MKNFLTEKLLLDTQHGKDCTLEVCVAGEPDADRLIFSGTVSDCLRKTMTHELAMTGDEYFSLSTRMDNYCGINFEEIAFRMGQNPEMLKSILTSTKTPVSRSESADLEFVFDEEIMVSKDMTKLEGYLWATDTLVARLKAQLPPLSEDQTLDNINFYPIYDAPHHSVSLEGHYYLEDGFSAAGKAFTLPLTPEESAQLISAFDAYCIKREGKSSLDLLNEARAQNGLSALSQNNLDAMIQSASARVGTDITDKSFTPER